MQVDRTIHCFGWSVPLQKNQHLWLVIEIDELKWPKEGEVLVSNGKWEATVFEDGNPPNGQFSLALYATTSETDLKIRQWLESGKMTGSYPNR